MKIFNTAFGPGTKARKNLLPLASALLFSLGASAQTTVTRNSAALTNVDPGSGEAWATPANAQTSDNNRAISSANGTLGGSTTSTYLVLKNFGFTIPAHATITAVQVRIEKRKGGSGSASVTDNDIRLLKGGTASGSNKALGIAWSTTEGYTAYGNTTNDLWSTTFTPYEINSVNFGVEVRTNLSYPAFGSVTADLDHIEISVTYTTTGAADKDGDGVADANDFDIDNDGIPNNKEIAGCGGTSNFNFTSQADGTDPATTDITSGGLTVNTVRTGSVAPTTFAIDNTYSASTEKEIHIVQTGVTAASKTTLTFSLSKPVANPQFYIQDIDLSAGQFIDNVKVTAYYQGHAYTMSAAEVTTGVTNSFIGTNTVQGANTAANDATSDGQVRFSLRTIADRIVIEYWNSDAAAGNQGMGIGGFTFCDVSSFDNDGDGIANYMDADSDGDGIPDIVETGAVDINGDGRVDNTTDTDGDGLANAYDTDNGGVAMINLDTDGDGVANSTDADSDGDGIPDVIEAGGTDADNDARLDGFTDTDGDGLAQSVDGDTNNDGSAENSAAALITTGTDGNSDGRPDSYTKANADRIGMPNAYDLDSDGDGILDVREAGFTDTNSDGIVDGATGSDGWSDTIDALSSLSLTNTDARGAANYSDIDADDDGITDNVEAQNTGSYAMPLGSDADGDGIDDNYDNNDAAYAGNSNNGLQPYNWDGGDSPDYLDADSDNDSVTDLKEGLGNSSATLTNTADADGDGLVDQFDTFDLSTQPSNLQNNNTISGMGNGGSMSGPSPAGSNVSAVKTAGGAVDRDFRNNNFVLAANLLRFDGRNTITGNKLNWKSATENDFSHYELERSIDGNSFVTLTKVNGRGAGINYEFLDSRQPAVNKLFYRLKLVDANGSFKHSATITIVTDSKLSVVVSPNPTPGKINICYVSQANDRLLITLNDVTGKQVVAKTIVITAGTNSISMNELEQLPAGQYLLNIQGEGIHHSQKIMHVKQ